MGPYPPCALQLIHLCLEHQVNRFMGCDYTIDLNHAWWYHRCTIAMTGHAFDSIGAVRA